MSIILVLFMSAIFCPAVVDTLFSNREFPNNDSIEFLHNGNDHWPEASDTVEGILIYEHFSDLEKAFGLQDDTLYIINFWATWCKPCVQELPHFENLVEHYENTPTKVILCSLDFPNQFHSKLVPFVKDRKMKAQVIALLDGKFNDWIDKISPDWSGAIPATLIYRNEKRHFYETTFDNYKDLEEAISILN